LALAVAAAALIHQRPQSASADESAFSLAADTIPVYGAKTFSTPTGAAANHVEQFTVAFAASTAYELRSSSSVMLQAQIVPRMLRSS
jgi:hypothetical protein